MEALGRQILVGLYDCDEKVLNDRDHIERIVREAVNLSGAAIITTAFHNFSPCGVSGVVVIAESHIVIHTWPEYRYSSIDILTCGECIDPWAIKKHLKEELKSGNSSVLELKRGVFEMKGFTEIAPVFYGREVSFLHRRNRLLTEQTIRLSVTFTRV